MTARDTLDTVDEFWADHTRRDGARVFLIGESYGGTTALTASEISPESFDGTLAMCTGAPVPWLTALYDIVFAALDIVAPQVPVAAEFLADIEQFPLDIEVCGGFEGSRRIAPICPSAAWGGAAARPPRSARSNLRDDLRMVRREYPTDIGSVDLLCRNCYGRAVVVEGQRIGGIDVESLRTGSPPELRLFS